MEGGEYFSCNLSLRCSMDTFGPSSMITSEQIASTEKYALDIEDLSLFYLDKLFIQSKMKWGEHFLDGLLCATLRECRTALMENINQSSKHK